MRSIVRIRTPEEGPGGRGSTTGEHATNHGSLFGSKILNLEKEADFPDQWRAADPSSLRHKFPLLESERLPPPQVEACWSPTEQSHRAALQESAVLRLIRARLVAPDSRWPT